MPDISMCATANCPIKHECYRSEASGTKPSEWRQSWSAFSWRQIEDDGEVLCDNFWPTPFAAARPIVPPSGEEERHG